MRRLIDADALKEAINAHDYVLKDCLNTTDKGMFTVGIMQAIDAQPTIDAVPVIRCKDCEDCTETKLYDGQRWNYCMRLRCVVKENDFCCWAERKYPKIKAKVTE